MFTLRIRRGAESLGSIEFQSPLRIGRDQRCEVRIDDARFSRLHAELIPESDACVLIDRGSMNGTRVSGLRLQRGLSKRLHAGAEFLIADCVFELGLADSARTIAIEPDPYSQDWLRKEHWTGPAERPIWSSGIAQCVVGDVVRHGEGALTLQLLGRSPCRFHYRPGQHVALRRSVEGRLVRQAYSLTSSPSRPDSLEITLHRSPADPLADWLLANARRGLGIELDGPYGEFDLFEHPSPKYLMLAAGRGILPILSILRWMEDLAVPVDTRVFYSMGSTSEAVRLGTLEALTGSGNRCKLVSTVTAEPPGGSLRPTHRGRFDIETILRLAPDLRERLAIVVGPPAFCSSFSESLSLAGLPHGKIHSIDGLELPAPPQDRIVSALQNSGSISRFLPRRARLEVPPPVPPGEPAPRRAGSRPLSPPSNSFGAWRWFSRLLQRR